MRAPRNRLSRFLTDSRPQCEPVFHSLSDFYREEFDSVMPDDASAKRYPLGAFKSLQTATRIRLNALEKEFRANEDEYWFQQAACAEIVPWFQKCWIASGGRKFAHRARLAEHDTQKRLDLVTGRWTKDS